MAKETIVIAGGGVAGLDLATRLGRTLGAAGKARIVLVDAAPTHFWKPLLHSVASGLVDPGNYHIDLARQAIDNGFEFVRGAVERIDRAARTLSLRTRGQDAVTLVAYDRLVLSFGSVTNFFGVPGAERHCVSLDSVAQAEGFRRRFLDRCAQDGSQVDIAIVGAGPTGIELAADLRHTVETLVRYRLSGLSSNRQVRIRILERGPRLLGGLDESVSAQAARKLDQLGIEVCTGAAVAEVREDAVRTEDGRVFPAAITVWAAGVKGPHIAIEPRLECNKNNQILVDQQLRTLDDPAIHAMGDCCALFQPPRGRVVPPSAQAARQQADFLYGLLTRARAKPEPRFRYRDYGALVTLGRHGTVGILLRAIGKRDLRVRGAVASLLYRWTYERYVMANLGLPRMLGHLAARWCRSKMLMPVRWH
jgi:NADH dehydrogenase